MPSEYDALLESQSVQPKSEYDALLAQPQPTQGGALSGIFAGISRLIPKSLGEIAGFVKGSLVPETSAVTDISRAGRMIGDVSGGASFTEAAQKEAPEVMQQGAVLRGEYGRREQVAGLFGLGAQIGMIAAPFVRGKTVKLPSLQETVFGKPEGLEAETAAETEVMKNAQKPYSQTGEIPTEQGKPTQQEAAVQAQARDTRQTPEETPAQPVAPVPQPEQTTEVSSEGFKVDPRAAGVWNAMTPEERWNHLASENPFGVALNRAEFQKLSNTQWEDIQGGSKDILANRVLLSKGIQPIPTEKVSPVSEAEQAPSVSTLPEQKPQIISTAVQTPEGIKTGETWNEPHDSIAARVAAQRPSPTQETGIDTERATTEAKSKLNPTAVSRLNTLADKKSISVGELRDPQKGISDVVQSNPQGAYDYAVAQSRRDLPDDPHYTRNFRKIADHIKKTWPNIQEMQPVPEGEIRPSGVATALKEEQKGFLIREPDGTERFTNDRGEAAAIANAAGQVKPENAGTTELHSQQLAEPVVGKIRQFSTAWDERGALESKAMMSPKEFTRFQYGTEPPEEVIPTLEANHKQVVADALANGLRANPEAIQKYGLSGQAKPVSTGGEAPAIATQPKEVPPVPPETPEALGEALKERPRNAGIANRVLQERAAKGEIPQAPEAGEGHLTEDIINKSRQNYTPERALAAAENIKNGSVSEADAGQVRIHEENLTRVARDAEKALDLDPKNPALQQAYNAAKDNLSKWHNETVQPMKTQWSNTGKSMQGATDIDTGSYIGLQKLAWDTAKRDFTAKEEPVMRAAAKRVSKAADDVRAAIAKAEDQVQKVLKPSKFMDLNQLRESLAEKLKSITC